jgi:lysine-specific demethylase 3
MWGEPGRDRDDLSWLLCTNRQPHEQEKLMLTQIIAGDSLATMGKRVHEARAIWGVPMYCGCPLATESSNHSNGITKDLLKSLQARKTETINGDKGKEGGENKTDDNNSTLFWLADVALSNQDKKSCEVRTVLL